MADFLAAKVTDAMGFPLSLGRVRVNVWGGVDLDSVALYYPHPATSETLQTGDRLLTIDRISLRYKLLPLLRRRFEVAAVQIHNPSACLDIPRLLSLASGDTSTQSTAKDSVALALPVGFKLNALSIDPVSVSVQLPDTLPVHGLSLSGLSLALEDVHVPRAATDDPALAQGRLRLTTHESRVGITWPEAYTEIDLNLDWRLHWEKGGLWAVLGRLALDQWRLDLDVVGKGLGESVQLNTLALRLGEAQVLAVQGAMDDQSQITGRLSSAPVQVSDILASAKRMAAGLFPADSLLPEFSGDLRLLSGQFSGTPEDVHFSAVSAIDSFQVLLPDTLLQLSPLHALLRASGRFQKDHLKNGEIALEAGMPGLSVTLPDSSAWPLGALTLSARAVLDHQFLPDSAWVEARCSEVLDGDLSLEAAWQRGDTLYWPSMAAQLSLSADSLAIEALPALPEALAGRSSLRFLLNLEPGGEITLDVENRLRQLRYAYLEEPVNAPPLTLIGAGRARWPELSQPLHLDSLNLHIGHGLWASLSAAFFPATGGFTASLHQLAIDNQWLWSLAPPPLLRQFEGLTLSGSEGLTAEIIATPLSDSMAISVRGCIRMDQAAVAWPQNQIAVEGMGAALDFSGDGINWQGSLDLGVKHAAMTALRAQPFEHLTLNAHWAFDHLDSLKVSQGRIASDFGVGGRFDLLVRGLTGNAPMLSAQANLGLDSGKGMEIVDNVRLAGAVSLDVSAAMDLSPQGSLHLHGRLHPEAFSVTVDTVLTAGPVHGDLPFDIDFDPVARLFIQNRPLALLDAEDYKAHRHLYLDRMPGLGTLRVDSLLIQGAALGPIQLDTRITSGRLEVPWLHVAGLSGNIGGALYGLARGGKLDSLAYGLSLDVARINSGALLKSTKRLKAESELNATARFHGQGIDFTQDVNVDGYFHITKIGSQFASTLLLGMDPQRRDRNIRLTRRLLNMGWKPRLFSFELRHGYVYPSLVLDQPWYSPIRLPEQMGLGRLPVAFFIKNMNTFSQ